MIPSRNYHTISMPIPFFSKVKARKAFQDLLRPDLKRVEHFMEEQAQGFEPTVRDYMETVCRPRGKLLRPACSLLVAGATGEMKDEHIVLASLFEMVHVASLVHDDIIDEASMRRNSATVNALWGNSLAVLLGDTLFAQAMVLGADLGNTDFCKNLATIIKGVCEGEVEQSSRVFDLEMTKREYLDIIGKKTALLFSGAAGAAAWISNAEKEIVEAMYKFGMLLGTSYQIYDDCLDMVGDEDDAGKTLHTDADKGKFTLPFFYLLESEDKELVEELRTTVQNRSMPNFELLKNNSEFEHAIRNSVNDALKMNEEAREILWLLPENNYRSGLADLIFYFDELLEDCCK